MYRKYLMLLLLSLGINSSTIVSNPAVTLLQEYLQINTVTHSDLSSAVLFWKRLAFDEGVPCEVHEFEFGYPVVVIKFEGTERRLRSIMLNSHMDVVAADQKDHWTYPPFFGYTTNQGEIWGRGSQDMKSVSIQHFVALQRLRSKGLLYRTVYMTLMPDEETGGENGMSKFVKSPVFYKMKVGFDLDEGSPYPLPVIPVFYQDKVLWLIRVDCYSTPTDSLFPEINTTAFGKCNKVSNTLLRFRETQYRLSKSAPFGNSGTFTAINVNFVAGGSEIVMMNEVSLLFEIRLAVNLDEEKFQSQLEDWIISAGDNITITYLIKHTQSPATLIDETNPYWKAIQDTAFEMNFNIVPVIPTSSTDARIVRDAGIPALGFSPMPRTDFLLHAVDERLNIDTFLKGITIFENLVQKLSNIPESKIAKNDMEYIVKTVTRNATKYRLSY